jgi:hypothetical protein
LTDEMKVEKVRVQGNFWVVLRRKVREFYCA